MEENTLKFNVTVDSTRLKQLKADTGEVFSGIKREIKTLTGFTEAELKQMVTAIKSANVQMGVLAENIGMNTTVAELRSVVKEINAVEQAEKRLVQSQVTGYREAARIQMASIKQVGQLRDTENKRFLNQIQQQNSAIKTEADKMLALMDTVFKKKSVGSGFATGAANVFNGRNNGTFSNILGAFGGGGRVGGVLASSADGALAGGGGAGALLGGLAAGAGVGLIIAGAAAVKELASQMWEAGKAAVKAAGDYEVTRNAITAFAGSASAADRELAALHETAKNTPGLSLESAEAGYRNLRALGFEAETARGLIAGLAKQKIISGADESSVQRVIVNLTQLSTHSSRASQDLREIFHALPSLRSEFFKAFGTLDPQKLANEFTKDPDKALEKLSQQMEKTKGVSGGLNDAFTKFGDAWLTVGREFGQPLLDPLTKILKNLTTDLMDNKDTFRIWGDNVANAITLVSKIGESRLVSLLFKIADVSQRVSMLGLSGGLSGGQNAGELGSSIRGYTDYFGLTTPGKDYLTGETKEQREARIATEKQRDAAGEADATAKEALRKAAIKADAERQAQLASLKSVYDARQSVSDDYYRLADARLKSHLSTTKAEEVSQLRQSGQIAVAGIQAKIASEAKYYAEKLKLTDGDAKVTEEVTRERDKTLSKLQSDLQIAQLNNARELAAKEREIEKERRDNFIKYNEDKIAAAKSAADTLNFDIQRAIDRGNISALEGFAKLRQIEDDSYEEIRKNTLANYQLRLQDETLTADARINLINQMNQAEIGLAEDHRRRLIQIDDDYYARQKEDLQRNFSEMQEVYKSQGDIFSGLNTFFNPDSFDSNTAVGFGRTLGNVREMLLNAVRRKIQVLADDLKVAKDELKAASEIVVKTVEEPIAVPPVTVSQSDYPTQMGDLTLVRMPDGTERWVKEGSIQNRLTFDARGKVSGVLSSSGSVSQTVQEQSTVTNQIAETVTKDTKAIEDANNKIKLILEERGKLTQLLVDSDSLLPKNLIALQKLGEGMAAGSVGIEGFDKASKLLLNIKHNFESADLESEIRMTETLLELAKKNGDGAAITTLTHKMEALGNQKITQAFRQNAESADLYANSLEGLNESVEKLKSGDLAEVLGVQYNAAKQVAGERKSLLEENIELEYRIAHVGEDSAERYRNAWLNAIYAVKTASIDAKVSQIESQVQISQQTVFNADVARAGILKAMAGAAGYTEIFQDAFLAVTQAISDGIGSLLGKATESLGTFGKILSNIATQLLTMITNRLMMKLLDMILPPTGSSGTGTEQSGFSFGNVLGGLGQLIFGGRGGGSSSGLAIPGLSVAQQAAAGLSLGGRGGYLSSMTGEDVGDVSSSIHTSDTLSGQAAHELGHAGQQAGQGAGSSGLSSFLNGGSFADIGKSLAAAAPMIGLSLGASLGGSSMGGSILGGLGGLAGGLAVGIGTGVLGTSGGIIGGLVGALGGAAMATGILAAVAVPLLIGGWLMGRDKQRKADEKTRTQYIGDALSQLDQILKDTKAHRYGSGQEAIDAANQVRTTYQQQASSIKDRKTRNIALKEINDRINPKITEITAAAAQLDIDKTHFADLIPEFATGGIVPGQRGIPRLVLAHGGEVIANLGQQTPEFLNAAENAGIPGIRGSGRGSGTDGAINVEFYMGTKAQNELFVNGVKSADGKSALNSQRRGSQKFDDRSTSF